MDFSARYVALGDSFTEGVGDQDSARPNGVRGWADVVAQQLARSNPGFGYANLAIRGRKLRQIMAEQVDAAVAMNPTLVTLYAGANDILRPKIDIDSLLAEYDAGVSRLSATGATVVLFTGFDAKGSKVFNAMRGRTAIYNELVREIADNHGALLVDYWRFDEYDDWRMWDEDRMHMSSAGHVNMAKRVLDVLEHEHAVEVPELAPIRLANRVETLKANARWVKESAAPWVARRLRGVSSGDGLSPKYAELIKPF
ncbi:SGNH/GDSL hydrolase family protein [Paenarthrobacter ilicis]|uniref:Lysophospholipase L1-like esterase n=1 Tax=Paenarthrobacter ilicis TaxID=43665 RepID=A0ABX0TKB7_9MICC|nr:SGNH/GDSL hydrolase family protein [Paenarthrobacter ilicis]MBM7794688.1 lysophospholipase L1-like esterase [Paenarthrobacter ilicis]NIJ03013.1 lysophospholipase L1-like esterase [Paenarthrobacter ilicis]